MARVTGEFGLIRRLMINAALRVVGAVSPSQQINAALNQLFAMSIGDRHPATLDQQLANKSWVYAANRQIAGRAVRAEPVLEIKQRQTASVTGGQMPKATAVYEHPFLTLLRQPNLDQSGMVFHWQQILQLNTTGRCYVLVEPAIINLSQNEAWLKIMGGQPRIMSSIARLTLLEPERVRPFSAVGRRFAAAEYFDLYGGHGIYPAAPATYAQREEWKRDPQPFVIRIFMPSPDTWNGQSVTEAVDAAINTTFGLSQMWQNQIKNGLHAGLIFYLKKRGMSEVERFEKAVAIVKQGIGKAGEPLVLPEETVRVENSPLNMADMQYENLATYARQEVLSGVGASDATVGITQQSSRASADTAERMLALGTIDPLNSLIADAYNAYLLPLYPGQSAQTWYELKYATAAAADEVVQTQVLTVRAGGPIITPNEARAEIGKPPVPGGDELRTPAKDAGAVGGGGGDPTNPFAALLGGQGGPQINAGSGNAGSLAGQHEGDKVTEPSAMPQIMRDTAATKLPPLQMARRASATREKRCAGCDDSTAEPMVQAAAEHQFITRQELLRYARPTRSIHPEHPLAALHDPAARRAKLKSLDQARMAFETECRRAIAPVFAHWKEAAVAAARAAYAKRSVRYRRRGLRTADVAQIADSLRWSAALASAYQPWATESARTIVLRALHDYGLSDAQIQALGDTTLRQLTDTYVQRRAREFADQVSSTQEGLIGDALSDGAAGQVSEDEFAGLVEGTFPSFDDPRMRDIARTETTMTTGAAIFATAATIQDALDATANASKPGKTGVEGSSDTSAGDTADTGALSGLDGTDLTDAGIDTADLADGAVQAGDQVGLMWLSMRDDKVRDSHRTADGQVVALGDVFTLDGCDAQFPGDDQTCGDPAEIVNCRCDAIVVPLDHNEGWSNQDQSWKNGG